MDLLLLLLRVLLAAVLYLFLGAVMLLLWRDLRRPDEVDAEAHRRYGRLVAVESGSAAEITDQALKPGMSFSLQPVTSLGRSDVNTVPIPDAFASAEHALLVLRGGQWWLEDRGSRNGTTLNSVAITGPTVVSTGDIVGVGRVKLKIELAD